MDAEIHRLYLFYQHLAEKLFRDRGDFRGGIPSHFGDQRDGGPVCKDRQHPQKLPLFFGYLAKPGEHDAAEPAAGKFSLGICPQHLHHFGDEQRHSLRFVIKIVLVP
ncbi:hypothetical protein SDC9_167959 [bioreactor metagenome]|uniref:Uncharacterized protein n=1 Tax=bioreactor metagenome TaxID=1076179 RepID=A0A645G3T7_9ZZZZ